MRLHGERGQTTTEYLMIAGLITACAIALMGFMYPSLRSSLRGAAECVMGDVCEEGPSSGVSPGMGTPGGLPGGGGVPGNGLVPPGTTLPGLPIGPIATVCEKTADEHAQQLAYFADDAYNLISLEPTGRRVAGPGSAPQGLEDAVFEDADSGFRAALYEVSPGSGQYVLAFAGTSASDLTGDVATDIAQSLGVETAQYGEAARLTRQAKDWVDQRGGTLELTGHSLGGGLAATGAMSTGLHATTFNMARPSESTIAKYGTAHDWENNLDNYEVEGEIIGTIQDAKGMRTIGRQHYLDPISRWRNPVSRHLMGDVKEALKEKIAHDAPC